jgi:predicted glutamine amidotransferase
MCRLLGVVASRPAPLSRLLAGDLEPFRALADEHCDGWGIAYRPAASGEAVGGGEGGEGGEPVVRKAPWHALAGPGFGDAVRAAETGAALLHLRKASPGMAVTPANTHPFAAAGVAFAHNGWFGPRAAVDPLAERTGHACAGETDSERYFALVLDGLRDGPPHLALAGAAAAIDEVAEVESLNALLLANGALYAFARYEPAFVRARGGDAGSYGMAYRADRTADGSRRVVVASNGWEQPSPAWQPLPNGCVLEVRPDATTQVHDAGAWRRAG